MTHFLYLRKKIFLNIIIQYFILYEENYYYYYYSFIIVIKILLNLNKLE